jgi:hypothetical protein
MPFFDDMKRSYAQVTLGDNDSIDVDTFIEATESMLKLFGLANLPLMYTI